MIVTKLGFESITKPTETTHTARSCPHPYKYIVSSAGTDRTPRDPRAPAHTAAAHPRSHALPSTVRSQLSTASAACEETSKLTHERPRPVSALKVVVDGLEVPVEG